MSRSLSPTGGGSKRAERERRIYCARFGHTKLRDTFFGYHYCARCGDTLGDSLGSVYSDDTAVYVHHLYVAMHEPDNFARIAGCNCPENAKKLTKRDLALVPRYNSLGYANLPPWKPKRGSIASKPEKPLRRLGPITDEELEK